MTLEEKNFCREQLFDHVERIGGKSGCPMCGSEAGAFSVKSDFFKCFACDESGDIFDLIALTENLERGSRDVFIRAKQLFLEESSSDVTINITKRKEEKNVKKREMMGEVVDVRLTDDFLKYVEYCERKLNEPSRPGESAMIYLINVRGLTPETIEKYRIGVDSNFKIKNYDSSNTDNNVIYGESLIIPYPNENYFAVRPLEVQFSEYYKFPGVPEPLFNSSVLYNESNDPVFIAEGPLDALSLLDIGVDAISLNGESGKNLLLRTLADKMTPRPLVLYLNNYEDGEKATKELCEELYKLGATYLDASEYTPDAFFGPSETLAKNRKLLVEIVEHVSGRVVALPEELKCDYVKGNCATTYLLDFFEDVKSNKNKQAISTGFPCLDDILDGGLYPGLYVLGAISSLGKTTYCLQMADNIAVSGTDVLFFSLEMAKSEVVSKSLSRISYTLDNEKGLSSRQILNGNFTEPEQQEHINKSIASYMRHSDKIYFVEGAGDVTADTIGTAVEMHVRRTGNLPVVMMDYIQIIASNDKFANDKQAIDRAVFNMKRLSRKYSIPILLISSFNRESYAKQVSMKSFKESGAIEYSSDVLMGIQIANMDDANEKKAEGFINQEKSNEIRKIELKILKNRNGITGSVISYDYNPKYNHYKEIVCKKHPKKMV